MLAGCRRREGAVVKPIVHLAILSLLLPSNVFAQDATSAARPRTAVRPPNVAPARGTDAGGGVPCELVTSYNEVQPAGPPPQPYGPGTPPQPAQIAATILLPPPPAPPRPAGAGGSGLGAAGAATRGIVIPTAPKLAYTPVEPPHAPAGTVWSNVAGVGLLKNGHLIVAERMPMYQLLEYDQQNRLIRSFGANIVGRVHGMRIDADDNIWLTDQTCSTVLKLNSRGEVLMTLGTKGKAGTWDEAKGDHLFNQPTDVAIGPTGDIFVSTGHGGPDPRVVRFDKNGKFITTWSLKHPDGSPATIHTIVVDRNNRVYVGDREVKVLRIFDASGKSIRDVQMKNLICGLFIDSKGEPWMTTGQDGMVMKIDWNGNVLAWAGQEGFGADDFGEAHYMTMTPDRKTIYVGDTVNNDIKRLQAN